MLKNAVRKSLPTAQEGRDARALHCTHAHFMLVDGIEVSIFSIEKLVRANKWYQYVSVLFKNY